MKKILLFLFIFVLSISSVSALTLCDNTEILDLPAEITSDFDYVIVRTTSNRYRLYSFLKDSDVNVIYSSSSLSITNYDVDNPITYYQTNSSGTSWSSLGSNNSGYTVTDVVLIATTVDITDNGNIVYSANYNLVCNSTSITDYIYVPDLENYKCFVVLNDTTIRAYKEIPVNNSYIAYRDYFYTSNYLYQDGTQSFSQYTTLPVCLDSSVLTESYVYRTDFHQILIHQQR